MDFILPMFIEVETTLGRVQSESRAKRMNPFGFM